MNFEVNTKLKIQSYLAYTEYYLLWLRLELNFIQKNKAKNNPQD
jgi:hypothetical protein